MKYMYLKNCNNLINSGTWSNKDPKGTQILDLVGVDQKIVDDSNKSSDNLTMIKLMDSHPTSGTPHPGCWKIQQEEWETN